MGTVCALILAEKGVAVRLWSNFPEQAAELQRDRENRRFLPGHKFPDNIVVTSDPQEAFADPQLVVSAVPCQFIRVVWTRLKPQGASSAPIVSVSKGIEISSLKAPSEILHEVLGAVPVLALSGPSIAPELADRQACAVVVAGEDEATASLVQHAFSNAYFRVYRNQDLRGVEIAGAAKNVVAIAAGIIDGLHAGCNAKAALLTRGIVEICRLGVALGAKRDTFTGLAGLGDLVTTCVSPVGRNRSAGEMIGQGRSVHDVLESTPGVIEGIPTAQAVLKLAAQHHVEMPITTAVGEILSGAKSPRQAITDLMTRQLKHE
jgi:glycerol-3-phosphate dehydrogenase (NAD(P)+)